MAQSEDYGNTHIAWFPVTVVRAGDYAAGMALAGRTRSWLILFFVATLALAGCQSDPEPPADSTDALDLLVASSAVTREAGTARIEQSMTMEFPEGRGGEAPEVAGGSVTVEAVGFLDLRGRRGRLSVTTEGKGLVGADALAGDMEMILDGEAMYMKSPFYQQLAPGHEPWLRVSFEELGLRGMSQLGQQDPLAFIEAMRGVYGNVEEAGREDVRGSPTTHYSAAIDIERLVANLPEGSRGAVVDSFEQLGISEMPIEAWLDDEGRLRRMTSEVALSGAATEGGRMELSIELYDFGVAFDLTVPPDDQVAEFSEVFGEVEKS